MKCIQEMDWMKANVLANSVDAGNGVVLYLTAMIEETAKQNNAESAQLYTITVAGSELTESKNSFPGADKKKNGPRNPSMMAYGLFMNPARTTGMVNAMATRSGTVRKESSFSYSVMSAVADATIPSPSLSVVFIGRTVPLMSSGPPF